MGGSDSFDQVVTERLVNVLPIGETADRYRKPAALFPAALDMGWYPLCFTTNGAGLGSVAPGLNILFYTPFVLARASVISDLASNVTVAGNARWGVYRSDPVTLMPSALVSGSDSGPQASGAVRTFAGLALLLLPGLYYAATVCDNATTTLAAVTMQSSPFGYNTALNAVRNTFTAPLVFGALPAAAPTPTVPVTQNVILIFARFSSAA